jgi:hypothetical protein
MKEITILKWANLQEENWDALLLGNGASIAIDDRFRYPSLYEKAYPKEEKSTERKLFEKLGTSDFERVLLACRHAELVNGILEKDTYEIDKFSNKIKNSLIRAVHEVHPEHNNVRDKLLSAARFASQFKTVINLNYDLTFYWGFLLFNNSDKAHENHFKDGFGKKNPNPQLLFNENWEWLRRPPGPSDKTTRVFYPHGNLCLARGLSGNEFKITATPPTETLLDGITRKWSEPDCFPLYVSEGTSPQKRAAIRRSDYLSNVYENVLTKLDATDDGNLLVYGWSFGAGDDHILEALRKNKFRTIVISVYSGVEPSEQQAFCLEVSAKIRRVFDDVIKLVFFDSQSPGCWIHPTSSPSD